MAVTPGSEDLAARDGNSDHGCDVLGVFVLPESENYPACASQTCVRLGVPLLIAGKLGQPIRAVPYRRAAMFWARVPETTVDEDGDLLTREHDVCALPIVERRVVHPVPEAPAVKQASNRDLWSGITPNVAFHTSSRSGR